MSKHSITRSVVIPVALIAAASLALAGCSSGSTPSGSASGKTLQIAYMSFAVANSYDAPMLAAAQAEAADSNAQLTVFDANNDPQAQFTQLQNAIQSGKYPGHHHAADSRNRPRQPRQAGHRQEDQGRQHRPDPGLGLLDGRSAGEGPLGQCHLRSGHHRQAARPAGRRGLCGEEPQPVQRRLPLRHQGILARRRAPPGIRGCDQLDAVDQGRRRGPGLLHPRNRPGPRCRTCCSPTPTST
ncbi:MAG: hypothetical protein WDM88_01715 [Galbitalea sp.]